jgi:uncharacterized membrane protein (DUF4010 family)
VKGEADGAEPAPFNEEGRKAHNTSMTGALDLDLVWNFGVALLVGALIGLDREKRKSTEHAGIGGLRTFTLIALAGAISAWLSGRFATPWIFAAAAIGVSALVVAGYLIQVRRQEASTGLTTEIAALVTFLLGGVCLSGAPALAVALGIVTAAALAWKQPLHTLVAKLGEDDIYAGLTLLIATFVVLPLLPHEPVDPWGALRPYQLWLLVVLMAALSLAGYVAVRWLGPGRGTAVTGLLGGLVSSTAVTLTFSRRSREEGTTAAGAGVLAAGLLLAWAVMFVRVVVIASLVHRPLLAPLIGPFSAMGLVCLAAAGVCYRGSSEAERGPQVEVALRNPFSLRSAVNFGLFFAGVLLVVAIARTHLAAGGLYAVAALAGLTDVDAITLSMATYARDGGAAPIAVGAIVIAAIANSAAKTGMTMALGAKPFWRRVLAASAAIAGAAVVTLIAG